ncbi:hypothetical protein RN001_006748 [Aquatica leii]|uniref:STAS domain-containing protein n=1 Tax=Aquatica leii TaxID=1421715 RepID=A0AAN7Q234_9COLE|nr:hypothetical protein RN001_006748 [Aquatica leii]
MPRKRVLKTNRVLIDEANMKQAIIKVFNGTYSERRAAIIYEIRRTTLQCRIKRILNKYTKESYLTHNGERADDSGNDSIDEDSPKYSRIVDLPLTVYGVTKVVSTLVSDTITSSLTLGIDCCYLFSIKTNFKPDTFTVSSLLNSVKLIQDKNGLNPQQFRDIEMEVDVPQRVKIDRPVYEQEQLNKDCEYEKPETNYWSCLKCKPSSLLFRTIPILEWLPQYNWRNDIVGDLIAGFTVAIMHIPQGMAYSLLANVPAVIGIYTAVFPVIIYFFFGTSKHVSMGTFAIVCLMTGKAVLEHSDPYYFSLDNVAKSEHGYSPLEVVSMLTFTVALVQMLMYVLRLGIISTLLSETLVSGFTTAAAFQVLTSQVKDLFGLIIPKHKGYFTVIKPRLANKCSLPIPIELIAVVLGTVASYFLELPTNYNVSVVGVIPSGIPAPTIPPFSLMDNILIDGVVIAIVSYAMSLSMALIFAQKLSYEVDANQELLATGLGNIFGSFFTCLPMTASISRSMIQQTVGGKTQLTSIISCGILILVLILIGPLFEALPTSILASVIIVALKGMLIQVTQFFHFWKLSKLDAFVWIMTFLTVIFISIDIGLLVGFILSLAEIIIMGFKPYTCLLGSVPNTDIYLDVARYKMAIPIKGIRMFHYSGGLNFALRNTFKNELYCLVGIHPQKELNVRRRIARLKERDDISSSDFSIDKFNQKIEKLRSKTTTDLYCIIIDFSAVSYIDPSGVSIMKIIGEDFSRINIPVYVAGCCGPVYEMMNKCGLLRAAKNSIRIFPTIHDAVQSAMSTFNLQAVESISIIPHS